MRKSYLGFLASKMLSSEKNSTEAPPPQHLATSLNSPPDDGKLRNFRQIVHLSLDIRHTTTEHVQRTVRRT